MVGLSKSTVIVSALANNSRSLMELRLQDAAIAKNINITGKFFIAVYYIQHLIFSTIRIYFKHLF
jgi:hypothetical protein